MSDSWLTRGVAMLSLACHPAGRPRRSRVAGVLSRAWAALVLLACPTLRAGPDLGSVVGRLPTSVDLALAVDNGSVLRRELGSMPLMLTFSTQPRPEAVFEAWSELAGELGMTDAEAFDLLLGRRVIIAGAELQYKDSVAPQWALLSEIDPATERSLREKLGAAPRRIVNGQVVLEFEHGSFLMATSSGRLRCTARGSFESTPASTLLHCRTPERPLSELPVGRAVEAMETRDAVFLSRLPDADRAPERFIAANIGLVDGAWQIDATLAPAASWVPGVDREAPRAWSPKLLETLPPDPALVMIGSRDAVREARLWAMPMVSVTLPDPESAGLGSLLGGRSMFAVWLGGRGSGGVSADGSADGPAEVLMATDTPNLDRLIGPADGFLAAQAPGAGGNASVRAAGPAGDDGPGPSEVRSVTVRGAGGERSADSTLNWLYVPEGASDAGVGRETGTSAARPGWWVLHAQPLGAPADVGGASPADRFGDMPARRYLHIGAAAPRRWGERLARLAAAEPTGGTGQLLTSPFVLPQIWSIRWAVWYDEPRGAISADVVVDLTPPEGGVE